MRLRLCRTRSGTGLLAASLAAGALLAPAVDPAPAAAYDQFRVGAWRGKSVVSRRTGRFSHCIASARYVSGRFVGFIVSRTGRIYVLVSDPRWNLRKGARIRMQYSIDDWWSRTGVAQAISSRTFAVRLTSLRDSLPRLRRGRSLQIRFRDSQFRFSLRGTRQALARLVICVRNELQAERRGGGGGGQGALPPSGNPDGTPRRDGAPGGLRAPTPDQPPNRPDNRPDNRPNNDPGNGGNQPRAASDPGASGSPKLQASARRLAARIIKGADLKGVRFVRQAQVGHMRRAYNAYWLGGSAAGAIRVVRQRPGLEASTLATRFAASDRKRCQGTFKTGKQEAGAKEALFFTRCEAGAGARSWVLWYSIVPHPKGTWLFILVSRNKRNDGDNPFAQETVKDVALRLHKSLQTLIGRGNSGGQTTDL